MKYQSKISYHGFTENTPFKQPFSVSEKGLEETPAMGIFLLSPSSRSGVIFSTLHRSRDEKLQFTRVVNRRSKMSVSCISISQIMNDFEGTEYISSGREMLEFLFEKDNWKMGKHGKSVVMLMIIGGYF